MPWARASVLDRHIECPAASHLPRLDRGNWTPGYLSKGVFVAPTVFEDKDSTAADWGTAMHAAKAGAPDAADPWLSWAEPVREQLWPSHLGEHEVSVSYDCRTREVELYRSVSEDERTAWKNSRGPDCITGTCDWWARLPSGEPWVCDLKTGWQKPLTAKTAQNLFYLTCLMKQPENEKWVTGRSSLCHCPRPKRGDDPEFTRNGLWKQVTRTELEAFEDELHWAWIRANGFNPAARPGAHCKYCPSALVCDRAND